MSTGRPVFRYLAGALPVGMALAIQWAFWPHFDDSQYMLLQTAVVLAALWVGLGPALLGCVLGVLGLNFLVMPPQYELSLGMDEVVRGSILAALAVAVDALARAWRRAELRLLESEERHLRVAMATNDALWDWDLQTGLITWNEGLQRSFGHTTPAGVTTIDWWRRHIHPEDVDRVAGNIARLIDSRNDNWSDEYRFRHASGTWAHTQDRGFVVRDKNGRPVRMIGGMRDVSAEREAQAALRESEERFREAFAHAPIGMVLMRLDGRFLRVSPAYCQLVGYTEAELLEGDLTFQSLTHVDDRDRNLEEYRRLLAGEIPAFFVEKRYTRKDGSLVWVRASATVQRDAQGQPSHIVGLVEDISERKRSAAALSESEERFRQLADSMPQLVWTADPDGAVDYYNRRWAEFEGIDPGGDKGWRWAPVLHPDDRQRTVDAWSRAVDTGEIYQIEHRVYRKDGSIRWILSRGVPVRDNEGRVVKWYGTATDIHDQKTAEEELRDLNETLEQRVEERTRELLRSQEALRESERLYRAIGESIPFGVWVCDPEGMTTYMSDSFLRMAGKTLDDCRGFGWADCLATEERETTLTAWRSCVATRSEWRWEHRFLGADGEYRTIFSRGVPIYDEVGEVRFWAGVNLDITERKRLEEALRQSERLAAIGQMITALSHESRNALQRSLACVEMLGRRLQDRPDALRLTQTAKEAHHDLQRVHDQIRDYASPIRLHLTHETIDQIWRDTWEHLATQRQGRDVELIEVCDSVDAHCKVDRFRLEQVFRNLLENSLQAAPDPVRIRIACARTNYRGQPALMVAIRDNGPGISSEQARRVFEPFYTTKAKGTGLGMVIVKRIVEAHGGALCLEPNPGQGAEVTIVLPCTPSGVEDEEPSLRSRSGGASLEQATAES